MLTEMKKEKLRRKTQNVFVGGIHYIDVYFLTSEK